MTDDTTQEPSPMRRRKFLRSVASIGVSGTALARMSHRGRAASPNNSEDGVLRYGGYQITNLDEVRKQNASPQREPVYYTISRNKWVDVESAHDARRQIEQSLPTLPTKNKQLYAEVGEVSPGRKAVFVRYPYTEGEREIDRIDLSYSQLNENLPSSITGVAGRGTDSEVSISDIPVILTRSSIELEYYEYTYRNPGIPAGCAFRNSYGNRGATIGTPAYSNSLNEQVLIIAGHSYDNYGGNIWQPTAKHSWDASDPNCIGQVNSNQWENTSTFDAAVVEVFDEDENTNPDTDYSTYYGFAAAGDNSYRSENIGGIKSHQWLRDHEGYRLGKQGEATGIETGSITYVGNTHFRTNADSGKGDSGGPHYRRTGSDTLNIAGIHKGSDPDHNYDSVATSIEKILNRWNMYI